MQDSIGSNENYLIETPYHNRILHVSEDEWIGNYIDSQILVKNYLKFLSYTEKTSEDHIQVQQNIITTENKCQSKSDEEHKIGDFKVDQGQKIPNLLGDVLNNFEDGLHINSFLYREARSYFPNLSSFSERIEYKNEGKIFYPEDASTSKVSKSKKNPKITSTSYKRTSQRLKNIVKNFGKQCANYAIKRFSTKLLKCSLNSKEIPLFRKYIKINMKKITNIKNFRELLLVSGADSPEIAKFKKIFQKTCEEFINFYSTNWIFNSSKIKDVRGHIDARFKLLRRIQNPEYFTYLH